MAEGRRGCEGFDVAYYRNRYTDLQRAYGLSLKEYFMHYLNYGIFENRVGNGD